MLPARPRPGSVLNAAAVATRAARAGLRLPTAVTIAITGACNLRCRHCWVEAGAPTSPGHAPTAGVLSLVDGFVALGVDAVWITGGEPLAHPDWPAILSHCCAQPSLRTVGVQTNGTLLDAARVAQLRAIRRAPLRVQVSLDGASPHTHDGVRGTGAFAETIAGMTRLVSAGFGGRTAIAFTEMRHNMEDAPALLELAARLGVAAVVGGTLVQDGRAAREGVEPPTAAQYRTLLERHRDDASFRDLYRRHGTFSAIEWWNGRGGARGDACAFFDHPYVGADGSAYPCRLCRSESFAVARAFERPLDEVLDLAISRWRHLLGLARARCAALPECRGCVAERQCAGGCMGRALASRGVLAAVEDRCELRKAVHLWDAIGDAALRSPDEARASRGR